MMIATAIMTMVKTVTTQNDRSITGYPESWMSASDRHRSHALSTSLQVLQAQLFLGFVRQLSCTRHSGKGGKLYRGSNDMCGLAPAL